MEHKKIYTDKKLKDKDTFIRHMKAQAQAFIEINACIKNILIPTWEDKDMDTDLIKEICDFISLMHRIKETQARQAQAHLIKDISYIDQLNRIETIRRSIIKLEKALHTKLDNLIHY